MTGIPLGPIDEAPWDAITVPRLGVARSLYRSELLFALAGVELGEYDHKVVDWVAGMDAPTVATVCSLLGRVRAAGERGAR